MASFTKRENGYWRARIRIAGRPPITRTFRVKAQAVEWARVTEDSMRGQNIMPAARGRGDTVRAVLERYEVWMLPRRAEMSQSRERSRLKLLAAYLGGWFVAELTAEAIIDYVDLRSRMVKPDTIRRELTTLSAVIKTARVLWAAYLPKGNPVTIAKEMLTTTKSLPKPVERVKRVTPVQAESLIKYANPQLAGIIGLILETGMRRGEIAKITRGDITGGILRIRATDTKTGTGRSIPLSKEAKHIVAALPLQLDKRLISYQPDSITRAFSKLCKRLGIKDLRVHDLRHEAISRWFEKGLEIPEVAAMSGHSEWKMLKRYTHVLPENIAKKLRRL